MKHKRSVLSSLKIKKDDDTSKDMRSRMVGEIIARGEYINKYGKIDDDFKLGEPYRNELGQFRYKIK